MAQTGELQMEEPAAARESLNNGLPGLAHIGRNLFAGELETIQLIVDDIHDLIWEDMAGFVYDIAFCIGNTVIRDEIAVNEFFHDHLMVVRCLIERF